MGVRAFQLLLLPLLFVMVKGQSVAISPYPFDCRRSNVGCSGLADTCTPSDGSCICPTGSEGFNCGLDTTKKAACTAGQCENDATCTSEADPNACYCNKDTYGNKCQYARVNVWCSATEMFINVYPHGDGNFDGTVYIPNENETKSGRTVNKCALQDVSTIPDITTYDYVKDAQDQSPTLQGLYKVLPLDPVDPTTVCTVATKNEVKAIDPEDGLDKTVRTDYLQRVILEYNKLIVNSLDQVVIFNCSVSSTFTGTFTSANAMSVTILDEDYQKVNATNSIEPVVFDIRKPDGGDVITNSITLGDPFDLVFSMQTSSSGGSQTFTALRVDGCQAFNPADDMQTITFLTDQCPTANSEMLFRGNIAQTATYDKTTVPLKAFRFIGDNDQVAFTCTITLCGPDNVETCKKQPCSSETIGVDSTNPANPANPTTTADPNSPSDDANNPTQDPNTPAENPNSPAADSAGDNVGGSRRRKRAARENEKEVTQVISVFPAFASGKKGAVEVAHEEDCMQQNEVITIIIIFAVVLALMLIIIVLLVLRLLRSRTKVVDASDMSAVDTQSRYTLPRLSIATTM